MTGQPKCDCPHPICTLVADVYVSGKPTPRGLYWVDRFTDCFYCGPRKTLIEVAEPPEPNGCGGFRLVVLVQPCRLVVNRKS